jgi:CDP-diacylglycerol pyrophosphatase
MRLGADQLAKVNPFALVSQSVPGGAEHMGLMTAALIGTTFADGQRGFYLIAREGSATISAHAEDLIDETCQVAK